MTWCAGAASRARFTPDGAATRRRTGVEFNPEKARALLAQAGFPGGKGFPRLELMTTSREVQKTMAEAIQGHVEEAPGRSRGYPFL